jgi:hypothetical protein
MLVTIFNISIPGLEMSLGVRVEPPRKPQLPVPRDTDDSQRAKEDVFILHMHGVKRVNRRARRDCDHAVSPRVAACSQEVGVPKMIVDVTGAMNIDRLKWSKPARVQFSGLSNHFDLTLTTYWRTNDSESLVTTSLLNMIPYDHYAIVTRSLSLALVLRSGAVW